MPPVKGLKAVIRSGVGRIQNKDVVKSFESEILTPKPVTSSKFKNLNHNILSKRY